MNKSFTLFCLMRLALWLLVSLCLPFVLDAVGVIWRIQPCLYATVCCFLFVLFELSTLLLRKRFYFYYIFFLSLAYFAFKSLPDFLAFLDFGFPFDDLQRLQRLRVNFVVFSMFRVVVAGSIIYHLFILRSERQKMIKAKLQAELSLLKSQITPHFFFNSLNSIYSLSLDKSDLAPEAIITLSDLMRYVLTDAKKDWIDLALELEYLERYVELQRLRLPLKTELDYQVEVEGDLGQIPPMLLISFYENAFKYGTSSESEEKIRIHLRLSSSRLCLETHNAIIHSKSPKTSTGNGIENTRRRLDLLYPQRYELTICETKGYYQLKLCIQLS